MKYSLVFLLSLLSAIANTQTPAYFQQLEGAWYREGRDQPCFQDWRIVDDQTLVQRTYSPVCSDTLEWSTLRIEAAGDQARLFLRVDSIADGRSQTYRLVRATADETYWENENPAGLPAHLSWILYNSTYLIFRADGVETAYRFLPEPKMRLGFRLQVGVNRSNLINKRVIDYGQVREYRARPGFEASLGLGLCGIDNPLDFFVEFGLVKREIGVDYSFFSQGTSYHRTGFYETASFNIGLMPEWHLGRQRRLSVQAGAFLSLFQVNKFKGISTITGSGENSPSHADPRNDVVAEHGFQAGLSYKLYRLGSTRLRPVMYCRGMFGLAGSPRVQGVSVGVGVSLGSNP